MLGGAVMQCKRENDTILYKHIPEELPSPPEPKRLATPTEYQLPAPSLAVSEGIASVCYAQPAQLAVGASSAAWTAPQPSTSMPDAKHAVASHPQQAVGSEQSAATDQEKPPSTACWRWLLVIVALPLLAIMSLIGIVVWIVLLPLKCCCCPVGMIAQLVWDAFEWLIKAPLRGLLWASGKPWKPSKTSSQEAQNSKTSSPV